MKNWVCTCPKVWSRVRDYNYECVRFPWSWDWSFWEGEATKRSVDRNLYPQSCVVDRSLFFGTFKPKVPNIICTKSRMLIEFYLYLLSFKFLFRTMSTYMFAIMFFLTWYVAIKSYLRKTRLNKIFLRIFENFATLSESGYCICSDCWQLSHTGNLLLNTSPHSPLWSLSSNSNPSNARLLLSLPHYYSEPDKIGFLAFSFR